MARTVAKSAPRSLLADFSDCDGGNSDPCVITCMRVLNGALDYPCKGVTVGCPDLNGAPCHLKCEESLSCESTTFTCPSGSDCQVTCSGEKACSGITVVGTDAASLTVNARK